VVQPTTGLSAIAANSDVCPKKTTMAGRVFREIIRSRFHIKVVAPPHSQEVRVEKPGPFLFRKNLKSSLQNFIQPLRPPAFHKIVKIFS
jgi:hypothetical protein